MEQTAPLTFVTYARAFGPELWNVAKLPGVLTVLVLLLLASSAQAQRIKRRLAKIPRIGGRLVAFLNHRYVKLPSFGVGALGVLALWTYASYLTVEKVRPPTPAPIQVVSTVKVDAASREELAAKDQRITDLQNENNRKDREVDALKADVRRLDDRASLLERQLADKNRQLDDRERKRATRTEIARLMNEGEVLKASLRGPGDKLPVLAKADAWADKTARYLQALDPSYAARFESPSYQFTFTVPDVQEGKVSGVWNGINQRNKELGKFLEELKD